MVTATDHAFASLSMSPSSYLSYLLLLQFLWCLMMINEVALLLLLMARTGQWIISILQVMIYILDMARQRPERVLISVPTKITLTFFAFPLVVFGVRLFVCLPKWQN